MSIFDIFKRERVTKPHLFTDEERELSAELRKQKNELQKQLNVLDFEKKRLDLNLQIAQAKEALDELRNDDSDDDDTEPDATDTLFNVLMSKIIAGNSLPLPVSPSSETIAPSVDLTEQEIREFIHKIPKGYLKIAKGMSDETLMKLIKGQLPALNEESVKKSLALFRHDF